MPVAAQDQEAFELIMMLSVGPSGGSESSDPAGMTATLRSGAIRGIGLPHCLQNTVRNRSASGTLNELMRCSPDVHLAESGLMMMLLA